MNPKDTQRPETTSYSVQDLVEDASEGLLRVPDWQRLFQWKSKHIHELLDSITRGYPIGTLLLWKRPKAAPAGRLELGPHALDAKESSDALWVIDGQQRVTSLAGVLLRRGPPDRSPDARDKFTWAYDLHKGQWVSPKQNEAWKPEWLPADRLVDATDLIPWLIAHKDVLTPAQTALANTLARNVREFEIPAIVVKAESDEALRIIFDRTNNAGRRLKAHETFDALQGALTPAQPSTIRALALIPVEVGFGTFDNDWLLRLVVQVGGGDMTQVSHDTIAKANFSTILPKAADALRRALVFIKNDVGISNEALLPYRLPIVILSVFFDKHPEPAARSRDLLARWVWRGAETGRHRGQDIGEVRETFAAIDANEELTVQRLLKSVPRREPRTWNWAPVNLRTASTRVELLALLSLAPRNLMTGGTIDGPALLAEHRAKALIRIAPELRSGYAGPLSVTRLLHPIEKKPALFAALLEATPVVAESHAIPAAALDSLRRGDIGEFLEVRGRTISELFARYLASRTRWDETDRPSIRSLTLDEEVE